MKKKGRSSPEALRAPQKQLTKLTLGSQTQRESSSEGPPPPTAFKDTLELRPLSSEEEEEPEILITSAPGTLAQIQHPPERNANDQMASLEISDPPPSLSTHQSPSQGQGEGHVIQFVGSSGRKAEDSSSSCASLVSSAVRRRKKPTSRVRPRAEEILIPQGVPAPPPMTAISVQMQTPGTFQVVWDRPTQGQSLFPILSYQPSPRMTPSRSSLTSGRSSSNVIPLPPICEHSCGDFCIPTEAEKPKVPSSPFLPPIFPQTEFTLMPVQCYFNPQSGGVKSESNTPRPTPFHLPGTASSNSSASSASFGFGIGPGMPLNLKGVPFCPPPPPVHPEDFPSFKIPQYKESEEPSNPIARPFDETLRDEVRKRLLQILNSDNKGQGELKDPEVELLSRLSSNSTLFGAECQSLVAPPPSSVSKDSSRASLQAQNSKESFWAPIPSQCKCKHCKGGGGRKGRSHEVEGELPNYVVKNAKDVKKLKKQAGVQKVVDDAKGSRRIPLPAVIGTPGFGVVPSYIKKRKVEIQIEKFRRLENEWREALLNLHEEARRWKSTQEEKKAKSRAEARKMSNLHQMHQHQTILVRDQVTGRLVHVPLSRSNEFCSSSSRSIPLKGKTSSTLSTRSKRGQGRSPKAELREKPSKALQIDEVFVRGYQNSSSAESLALQTESRDFGKGVEEVQEAVTLVEELQGTPEDALAQIYKGGDQKEEVEVGVSTSPAQGNGDVVQKGASDGEKSGVEPGRMEEDGSGVARRCKST